MVSKNIQVTKQSKEKIHYGDSKKKTNTHRVYIGVIRPVKTAVIQRATTDNLPKVRDLGALSLKWDVIIKSLASRFWDLQRKGGRKAVRAGGGG